MTYSFPNPLSFRSAHNRSLEQLLLPDYLGCAGSQAMAKCHSRIEEFEALLENLWDSFCSRSMATHLLCWSMPWRLRLALSSSLSQRFIHPASPTGATKQVLWVYCRHYFLFRLALGHLFIFFSKYCPERLCFRSWLEGPQSITEILIIYCLVRPGHASAPPGPFVLRVRPGHVVCRLGGPGCGPVSCPHPENAC